MLRGRAEHFDGMLRGGVAEDDRVGWLVVGEAAFAGGLAGRGGEVLEARRGGDLQGPQRLLRVHEEGVRQPDRQQDEVARPGLECLPVAAELRGTWTASRTFRLRPGAGAAAGRTRPD